MFRIICLSVLLLSSAYSVQKHMFLYSEEVSFIKPINDKGASIYRGTPVIIKKKIGNKTLISIQGYFSSIDKSILYATQNHKLMIAKNIDMKNVKKNTDSSITVMLEVENSNLTEDVELAWEEEADIYYEKCSVCHAAPRPNHFGMITWGGVYNGMKSKAVPTKEEEASILRYVRSHAKDGIIK